MKKLSSQKLKAAGSGPCQINLYISEEAHRMVRLHAADKNINYAQALDEILIAWGNRDKGGTEEQR